MVEESVKDCDEVGLEVPDNDKDEVIDWEMLNVTDIDEVGDNVSERLDVSVKDVESVKVLVTERDKVAVNVCDSDNVNGAVSVFFVRLRVVVRVAE